MALRLGHRRSVDFDWFASDGLEDPLLLADELRAEGVPFVVGSIATTAMNAAIGNRLKPAGTSRPAGSCVKLATRFEPTLITRPVATQVAASTSRTVRRNPGRSQILMASLLFEFVAFVVDHAPAGT